jgi:hypothetical protein
MKGYDGKLCTGCVQRSILIKIVVWSVILSKHALHVSVTNLKVSTRPACSNLYPFHLVYGQAFQWTSLRHYQKVHGKSVILTVVDMFSKFAHSIPLGHPYTTTSVARAFFNDIVCLHDLPELIVSDRDPVFTGHVWRDLF